jgi:phytoene desaturase
MEKAAKQVIIIGSGVAGMAAAIRLAVGGHSVIVYEQQSQPGGKLSAFEQKGFFFDKGPSLLTQPENIEELFKLAGEPIEEYFQYKHCTSHCNYFWEDGTMVKAYSDPEKFSEELTEKLQEDKTALQQYLAAAAKVYNQVAFIFLKFSLHKRSTWLNKRVLKAFGKLDFSLLKKTLHQYNIGAFKNVKTAQIFDRYATYNGSNPYTAPAMLSVISHVEYSAGAYYAKAGMINITQALYKLATKLGVVFHFDAKVSSIIADSKVHGIVVNDENVFADIVVSNLDVYYTFKNLLNDNESAKKILIQERSSSACIFYWGVSKIFDELSLHNIMFTEDYDAEFNHIFKTKKLYNDPTVYINITSKEDSNHAPPGKENWFVMVNVPATTEAYDEATIKRLRDNNIKKISGILKLDISKYIETETIMQPAEIDANTGSYMGSLYGTSSNARLAAFVRHPNFSKQIKGLYFCGGSVHPGGGIPLCLHSAAIVNDLIAQQYK